MLTIINQITIKLENKTIILYGSFNKYFEFRINYELIFNCNLIITFFRAAIHNMQLLISMNSRLT